MTNKKEKFNQSIFTNPFFKEELYECSLFSDNQKHILWAIMRGMYDTNNTVLVDGNKYLIATYNDLAFMSNVTAPTVRKNVEILINSKILVVHITKQNKRTFGINEIPLKETIYLGRKIEIKSKQEKKQNKTVSHALYRIETLLLQQNELLKKLAYIS